MPNTPKSKSISTNKPLENFFTFLNEDLENIPESGFFPLALAYARFLTHGQSRRGLIDFQAKYQEFIEGVAEETGPSKKFEQRKGFLGKIQSFLRSLTDGLVAAGKGKEMRNWGQKPRISGDIIFGYDAGKDRLTQSVIPKGIRGTGALDLNNEKKLAKLALADLILEYDLAPSRFMKCPWCGNYFYKSGKKKFCSNKCSNAYRQKQFREKT
jgi:hypothetical protein